MGRPGGTNGLPVPQAAFHILPQGHLGGMEGFWRPSGAPATGMGAGLDAWANGPGAGLVPRPKFEKARQIRALGDARPRKEERLARFGTPGRDATAPQLLDDLTSHRITDRSGSLGDAPGLSGSSEEGAKPALERGRAPRPCGWRGRASTKTVTRRRPSVPPLACCISRPERPRKWLGSESRAVRRRDSWGASHRRSSRA